MFGAATAVILVVFGLALLVSPFIVNAYFQRKAGRYEDEILEDKVGEFNKQIKGKAVALLIRRSIWGLLFLSGMILNFRAVLEQGFSWWKLVFPLLGIACFVSGILGYRSELKRLKPLK
jgi:NhaP-type Na+/H+ or K+/H+ antiporter